MHISESPPQFTFEVSQFVMGQKVPTLQCVGSPRLDDTHFSGFQDALCMVPHLEWFCGGGDECGEPVPDPAVDVAGEVSVVLELRENARAAGEAVSGCVTNGFEDESIYRVG
ncbi:hypothetical protein H483_0102290 [Dietzia sp. UCD-THP]|uniref:hypothetical protein n=1 Tax=Dietzia sp. UCD-THP TaxID=1292020 RepID=UPI0003636656|nr:hypothetical protein [Dietzia sp. UCD-THP]EYT65135.1 hypothetical protein H483_0102290 [Dietzia sp. UCD-THP]